MREQKEEKKSKKIAPVSPPFTSSPASHARDWTLPTHLAAMQLFLLAKDCDRDSGLQGSPAVTRSQPTETLGNPPSGLF